MIAFNKKPEMESPAQEGARSETGLPPPNGEVNVRRDLRGSMRRAGGFLAAIAVLVVSALVVFTLENVSELAEKLPLPDWVSERMLNAGYWYQNFVTLTPRPMEARFCALVGFSTEGRDAPLLSDACAMRSAIAELLPRLISAHPAMIVSDITFNQAFCGSKAAATQELQQAIDDTLRQVPLVVGRSTRSWDKLSERQREEFRQRHFRHDELLLIEPMPVRYSA
jgi:hypothetical protein